MTLLLVLYIGFKFFNLKFHKKPSNLSDFLSFFSNKNVINCQNRKVFLWELTRQAPLREATLCPKSLVAWHWQDNWEDHATTQYTNTTDEIKLTVTSVSGVERIDRWKKMKWRFSRLQKYMNRNTISINVGLL